MGSCVYLFTKYVLLISTGFPRYRNRTRCYRDYIPPKVSDLILKLYDFDIFLFE
jgi:hypothetical protein